MPNFIFPQGSNICPGPWSGKFLKSTQMKQNNWNSLEIFGEK